MKPIPLLAVFLVLNEFIQLYAQETNHAAGTPLRNPVDAVIWNRVLDQAATAAFAFECQTMGCPSASAAAKRLSVPGTNDATPLAPLPPLPPGVAEIKFGDFFRRPIGPRGLELTDKLKALDGRRVRLLGYMVQEERAAPGRLLLTPFPVQLHSHDNDLADDLPPSTVRVLVPEAASATLPFTSKLLLLTGTLSLGNRAEADGRTSLVRLSLDSKKVDPSPSPSILNRNPTTSTAQPRPL